MGELDKENLRGGRVSYMVVKVVRASVVILIVDVEVILEGIVVV